MSPNERGEREWLIADNCLRRSTGSSFGAAPVQDPLFATHTVDTGVVEGKRKQLRRRYATERKAREALAGVLGQLAQGTHVQVKLLQVTMGHASIVVTARTYADLYDSDLDRVADALDWLAG